MVKSNHTDRNRKQGPGSNFNQPSDELVKENTQHDQEAADSRDHDKQSGKGVGPKKPAPPTKAKPGKP